MVKDQERKSLLESNMTISKLIGNIRTSVEILANMQQDNCRVCRERWNQIKSIDRQFVDKSAKFESVNSSISLEEAHPKYEEQLREYEAKIRQAISSI